MERRGGEPTHRVESLRTAWCLPAPPLSQPGPGDGPASFPRNSRPPSSCSFARPAPYSLGLSPSPDPQRRRHCAGYGPLWEKPEPTSLPLSDSGRDCEVSLGGYAGIKHTDSHCGFGRALPLLSLSFHLGNGTISALQSGRDHKGRGAHSRRRELGLESQPRR